MKVLKDKALAIVDVETTGTSPTGDRIIEIGIIRVEDGEVVETFESLINPESYLPPVIEGITGIKASDLETAPTFDNIASRVGELLDGAVFMAHNARFDYGFIKNEFKRLGIGFNAKCLCTVRLSRKLYPAYKRHDLTSIIERFSLVCERRHRALDDARVLYDFMAHIDRAGRGEELIEATKALLSESTMPQFLDDKTVRALPEGAGVYIFYGPEDEVLYVGKSRNIRYRVLSHFSNDHASTKEMHLCQETVRVEAITTAGELSAMLLESELIKGLSPIYNRMLRRRSELVAVRGGKSGSYLTAGIERVKDIDSKEYRKILAIFRNVRQAKEFLAQSAYEYRICPKLLGLEKGKGACFASQIGKCSGACAGRADAEEYNQAFKEVFKKRRIRAWPFDGAIAIEEKKDDEVRHTFILDNWCLLADYKTGEYDTEERLYPARFDYDAYKILLRYIKDPANKKRIKPIGRRQLKKTLALEPSIDILKI